MVASAHIRSNLKQAKPLYKEQGVALLTVMLTLTLAILLASGVVEAMKRQTQLSSGLQNREQGWWYARSAEALAIKALKQDFKDDKEVVHLGQYWATSRQTFPMEKGSITGRVFDRQACFNLNGLIIAEGKKPDEQVPVKMLKALLENHEVEDLNIALATVDWVNAKTEPLSSTGADDDDYLSLPVAYLAGNTFMRDKSEWRAVMGVTPATVEKVQPDLCALPASTLKLNVNTIDAEAPELMAAVLLNRISVDQAKDLLKDRPRDGWRTIDEFFAEGLLSNIQKKDLQLFFVVKSDYFEVDAQAQIDETRVRMQSLLVRGKGNALTVVRRRTGELL
ncbi:type II secretion protein K [Endozoicomonas sp. OPT23]|uniref:type II secretion system minor pseudopilin GspK n=1 Tax=Endozoicomonas sp. OPT23 TaxID=2072845 RepID=UPI00129A8E4E|nr:type II secretion system minor pseudopilin GspK [Endozoicomonas sp. OPT23]MRI32233.1 type II secretion protein K [Endozoicomonas sp. OPT23]